MNSFTMHRSRRYRAVLGGVCAAAVPLGLLAGCGSGNGTSPNSISLPTGTTTPTPVASATPTPIASATPTPTPSATPTPAIAAISVVPTAATIPAGGTLTIKASVANVNDQAVTYAVQGGDANGVVTTQGVYTAPATPGTYIVVVTSNADPTKTATTTITVVAVSTVGVSLSPAAATISVGENLTLTATVNGIANQGVTYSVQGGSANGTVTTLGVYTAPAAPGTYTVLATSAADASVTGTAVITVQAGSSTLTIN